MEHPVFKSEDNCNDIANSNVRWGELSQYSGQLRAGLSADQMSLVARFSESALEPGTPPLQQESRPFPGGKAVGAWR